VRVWAGLTALGLIYSRTGHSGQTSTGGRLIVRGLNESRNFVACCSYPMCVSYFMVKPQTPQWERTMNIFYIIGVVVVILFVAGFLGLR